MSHIDARPGFTLQALQHLKEMQQQDEWKYSRCSLMLDAMSLRKNLVWDAKSHKMIGFVDYGTGAEEDEREATEALVVMAVGLNSPWKIPIGYFLIHGISAAVQVDLIRSAISILHEHNIRCMAIVMDGHPTNTRMVSLLGGSLSSSDIRPFFPHPSTSDIVCIFFLILVIC
jgi:hypothetical protein